MQRQRTRQDTRSDSQDAPRGEPRERPRYGPRRGPQRGPQRGPRRDSTRSQEPDRKAIKTWERIETILDVTRNVGKFKLDIHVAIEQPTFVDDTKGYQKITATIGVDDRYIRLNTRAFGELLDALDMHHEKFSRAIGQVHEENDKIRAEREGKSP